MPEEVKITTRAGTPRSGATADTGHAFLVVYDLPDPSPSDRLALAAVTGLSAVALSAVLDSGRPVVLDQRRSNGDAAKAQSDLSSRYGLATRVVTPGSPALLAGSVVAAGGAAMLLLISALFVVLGAGSTALVPALLALIAGMAAVGGLGRWRRRRHDSTRAADAMREAHAASPQAHPAWAALVELRRRVVDADLPAMAQDDLTESLESLERALPADHAETEALIAELDRVLDSISSSEAPVDDAMNAVGRLQRTVDAATDTHRDLARNARRQGST